MPSYDSFIKATKAFFTDPPVSIEEFKNLTTKDKIELSEMLNAAGYEHPNYVPKEA